MLMRSKNKPIIGWLSPENKKLKNIVLPIGHVFDQAFSLLP